MPLTQYTMSDKYSNVCLVFAGYATICGLAVNYVWWPRMRMSFDCVDSSVDNPLFLLFYMKTDQLCRPDTGNICFVSNKNPVEKSHSRKYSKWLKGETIKIPFEKISNSSSVSHFRARCGRAYEIIHHRNDSHRHWWIHVNWLWNHKSFDVSMRKRLSMTNAMAMVWKPTGDSSELLMRLR